MFWKYNSPSSVQIDALLQQENVSLNDLMEEEELLQECKAQNKKLVDFLTQPEILEELVTFLVTDPSPDKELQMRFKYANMASELLTCDVPAIVDKVAASSNLLQMLYRFLEKEKPLNPLLASFVSKVFGMLVQRRSEQNWYSYQFTCFQVLDFLKSQGDFVEVAVKHIGTSAVMDLLSKLISGVDEDDQEIKRGIHQWLNECRLIEQLIDKLSPDCDSEEHSSVDQLLCEIVTTGQDTSNSGSDSQMNSSQSRLLTTLESKEVIDKLMDTLLHEDRSESSVSHVINILLTLLSYKGSHKQSNFHHTNSIEGNNSYLDSRTTALRTILARLPDLQKILMQPAKLGNLTTAYGMEVERLGSTRLKVVSLIAALMATQDVRVHSEMTALRTLQLLFELFFKFSLNNFVHTHVSQCVVCILSQPVLNGLHEKTQEMDGLNNNPQKKLENGEAGLVAEVVATPKVVEEPREVEQQPVEETPKEAVAKQPLLVQLFAECNIIQKILECYSNEEAAAKEKMLHNFVGYMGHLREIANAIVESSMEGPCADVIQNEIKKLPNDVITQWEEFTLITLAEINLKNKIIPLQGFKEGDMDSIGDMRFVEDFKETEENLGGGGHRLSNQMGGSSLGQDMNMDDGLENSQEKFEEMCSERNSDIHAFDDIWKDRERNITFGSLQKCEEEDNPHSSSEEEGEIDEEFDTLRSADEKMDVDFYSEVPQQTFVTEWSEVFDKRGNAINVDGSFNPWQSAPASETTEHNSWADFGASPYSGCCRDPFTQGDSRTQSGSNFAPFSSPTSPCATSHPPSGFQTDFSNVLFSSPKENAQGAQACFPVDLGQASSSRPPPGIVDVGGIPQLQSEPGSLQDVCDATKTVENMHQNFVSQDGMPPDESTDAASKEADGPSNLPALVYHPEGSESLSSPSPGSDTLQAERIDSPPSDDNEDSSRKLEPSSITSEGCSPGHSEPATLPAPVDAGQGEPSEWEGEQPSPMPLTQEVSNPTVENSSSELDMEKDSQSELSSGTSNNNPN